MWNEDRPLGSKWHQWVTMLGDDDDDDDEYDDVTGWECVCCNGRVMLRTMSFTHS